MKDLQFDDLRTREAYQMLQANLKFLSTDWDRQAIAITSCVPQEGKSQVANNFARSLAQLGKRVLLIDGDMRRPRQHTILGLSKLNIVKKMDYDRYDIWLNINSKTENKTRLNSCKKEPDTVEWLENFLQEGDVLYDIGANVGVYSLVAAKYFAEKVKIYAFEPAFMNFGQLCKNIALNQCQDNIIPLQIALVVYLRRQDNYLISQYRQFIGANKYSDSFKQFISEQKWLIDYYQILKPWQQAFEKENIIVKVFEKNQFNNDLLDDFFDAINYPQNRSELIKTSMQSVSPSVKETNLK